MKTSIKSTIVATAIAVSGAAASANTIVDSAAGDERFSPLVAAVSAAGLVETLSGPGPFTVYAPVNDAFAALPDGTVETLLQPENIGQLQAVLTYHVDDRRLLANEFAPGANFYKPVNTAERLCIDASAGGVTIADGTGDEANVIIANIEADNGVIHVIDKVLLPGTRPDCH
ncbi:MAG: fasciclin domain-containing protein [Pseudomonadota bacterium]